MKQEEFNQLIGYRLKEAQSLLRSRMEEALRPLGITVAQYVCLEILKSTRVLLMPSWRGRLSSLAKR